MDMDMDMDIYQKSIHNYYSDVESGIPVINFCIQFYVYNYAYTYAEYIFIYTYMVHVYSFPQNNNCSIFLILVRINPHILCRNFII